MDCRVKPGNDKSVTDTRATSASIIDRVHPVAAGAPIVAVHFLGSIPVFVLGEQELLFAEEGNERRIAAHGGAILESAADERRIITGGDDGNVVATDRAGAQQTVATDGKKRWIDHVALGPDGAIAWSAGKSALVRTGKGEQRTFDAPSTVAGLAFAPKGFRLAVAHYNGVTLWFPNATGAAPEKLEWKGSHLGVAFSLDGKFLVTTMQEPMLHGWRLADGKHMRMSGYSARVRSLGWTNDGAFLATSGSEQVILWPYEGKDGPMGKQPRLLAPSPSRVSVVACHPKQPVVAAGFADGMVLLVRVEDGAEILVRRPGDAPVTALGWSADGMMLAIGCEDGAGGVAQL
ncbi:MAG TPA: WD40 repeat domain-containing protein [Pseudolabrys sp.]|nr:WD40 repeat domain-containing protein [Pseudolabrys sp.]